MTPALVHIVDDDDSVRQSLSRLLTGAGHKVVLYARGEDLLAVAGPDLTGCLLLDLRLPGCSGLELQRRLTEQQCLAPVVFLTGHGEVAAGVRAMKLGAVDFLEKPVTADVLLSAIATAIDIDTAARERRSELLELQARVETLSARELEVWRRVVAGQLNKQVAYELGIVERTVKLHRHAVMKKLRAQSLADLVRVAERLGITNGEV